MKLEILRHGDSTRTGTRSRTKWELVQESVSKRVLVFDLAHALAALELVPTKSPWQLIHTTTAEDLARKRWRGDVDAVRAVIGELRVGGDATPGFLLAGRGALVGWSVPWPEALRTGSHELCTDLGLTVEVLSRRVGELLILSRTPQFDWKHLFGMPFALDDERFDAVSAAPIAPLPRRKRAASLESSGGLP